jgi:uncharacterized protein (TIGR02271 family)
MTGTQRTTVIGVFQDRHQAQEAVADLRKAGFPENKIGVIAREDAANAKNVTQPSHDKAVGTGAAAGAATGAGIGALWALGIAAGVLPAIGPVIAGGIFASILASAAGGAAAGGIVGALIGLGIPEDEARYYEGEFQGGRTVVTVQAEQRAEEARSILMRHGGYDRNSAKLAATSGKSNAHFASATTGATHEYASATHSAQTTGTGTAGYCSQGELGKTVQVREEELRAHKQPVETGEVRVRKEVHVEHKTLEVPVEREEVVIERRPASGRPVVGAEIREGEEIRIPVKEEQVRVEKTPVVKEEVAIGKRKVQENKTVGATIRKEEVKVEKQGDVKVNTTEQNCTLPKR